MKTGGIILCGGRSTRMGRDKATLPFGPEVMLQRVVRVLGEVIDTRSVVVACAPEQVLPPLPVGVEIVRDEVEGRGPLEGMAAGMRVLLKRVDAAYVTSCDAPLVVPAFVTRLFELLDGNDVVVPREGDHFHPLAAVYRPSILPVVERLLGEGRAGPRFLFEEVRTRFVDVAELRVVDPGLRSLVGVNNAEEYAAALRAAGVSAG